MTQFVYSGVHLLWFTILCRTLYCPTRLGTTCIIHSLSLNIISVKWVGQLTIPSCPRAPGTGDRTNLCCFSQLCHQLIPAAALGVGWPVTFCWTLIKYLLRASVFFNFAPLVRIEYIAWGRGGGFRNGQLTGSHSLFFLPLSHSLLWGRVY